MPLNNDFVNAVSAHRMWEVYQRLADILIFDPSLKEQDNMLRFAESNLPSLYQSHDGEKLAAELSNWTDEYYKEQKRKLEKNFSLERLDLLRKMTKYKFADIVTYRENAEKERQRAQRQTAMPSIEIKRVGGAAAVVGIVVAGVGIGIGSTVMTVAGAIVTVGGLAIAVVGADKK
jgi:hypothetical protein